MPSSTSSIASPTPRRCRGDRSRVPNWPSRVLLAASPRQSLATECETRDPKPGTLSARLQIERLHALLAAARLILDFLTFAQVVEARLLRHGRTMKEDVVTAVVGGDEAKALVTNDLFDGSKHD